MKILYIFLVCLVTLLFIGWYLNYQHEENTKSNKEKERNEKALKICKERIKPIPVIKKDVHIVKYSHEPMIRNCYFYMWVCVEDYCYWKFGATTILESEVK